MNIQEGVKRQLSNISKPLAVANVRRSSIKQEGNQSFEIQIMALKEYAEKKGFYLPDEFIFIDDATSAFRKSANKRSGMNQMKEAVLAYDIAAVVFYDFSRIDRKVYSFVSEFYQEVITKKPNLKFYTTTKEDEWTPNDLDVKLQFLIANAESVDKSRRAVDAQKKDLAVDTGVKRPGSKVPFGYRQQDKRLVPDENAPIVLFIFYLATWGHSIQKIADFLNEAKIPSPSKKKWCSSSIENILKNPVYMGHLSWNFRREQNDEDENLFEHQHEMIVPKVFYKLVDINRELKKKYNKLDTPFLFSGLLRCNVCQKQLLHRNGSTKKNGTKYVYQKYFCENCSYEMDVNQLHDKLLHYVKEQFAISVKVNSGVVVKHLSEYVQALNEQLALKQEKAKIVAANENHAEQSHQTNLISIYRNVKQKINEEITLLEQSIKDISLLLTPAELDVFLTGFQNLDILKLSATEQRLIILNYIKEIVITIHKENKFEFDIQFKANPVSFITD